MSDFCANRIVIILIRRAQSLSLYPRIDTLTTKSPFISGTTQSNALISERLERTAIIVVLRAATAAYVSSDISQPLHPQGSFFLCREKKRVREKEGEGETPCRERATVCERERGKERGSDSDVYMVVAQGWWMLRGLVGVGFGRGARARELRSGCGRVSARRGAPAAARHDSTPGERRCTQILPPRLPQDRRQP